MRVSIFFLMAIFSISLAGQTNTYKISFENAVHHEASIEATFQELESDTLALRMSRTSPGRYALHEFAKNVYNFKAYDSKGNSLEVLRPDPYQWLVVGHDGSVSFSYTLFANRGDGTYSQIDETHAHLNIPATFMFSPSLSKRNIEVKFQTREDLNWKIATQLPLVSGTTYKAPDLFYFMDSPVEISDFGLREFEVTSANQKTYKIQLALHHNGSEEELDTYFESVKKIVLAEQEVYGELPDFDYGKYVFLACYVPNASGDGMEHRNSTILTSRRSLAEGGMERNIGTVSHEFFHAWNVERIRPRSLEPFDFTEANMSGELWFAEGFTSYYTGLILCRAGIRTPEQYVEGLSGTFNYVWNSPGRRFFNPIEMSYQAPFVDAATSVDPVNRNNTFISYYSYGSVLGLALDLSLRAKGLNLDDYMKKLWHEFGKNEKPYSITDLHNALNSYAGKAFGDRFFNDYIYNSKMPDYVALFQSVGVVLKQDLSVPYFGAFVSVEDEAKAIIQRNTTLGGPAYEAGLDKKDIIKSINGALIKKDQNFADLIKQFKVGDQIEVIFTRYEEERTTNLKLGENERYQIELQEKEGSKISEKQKQSRRAWLKVD